MTNRVASASLLAMLAAAWPASVAAQGVGVDLITIDDYPAAARGAEGTTAVVMTIDVAGRVGSCRVTQSSGSDVLDETTCRLLSRRGRYRPGTDAQGAPIETVRSQRVRWTNPGPAASTPPPVVAAPRLIDGLPVAVRKDLLVREMKAAVTAGNRTKALDAIDRYRALDGDWTYEVAMIDARTAFASGKIARAESSLKSYLSVGDRADEYYVEAIALYPRVQQALAAYDARKAIVDLPRKSGEFP